MTDAELAILSIVAEGPIDGASIQTVITRRSLRVYTPIGVSSMYYVLRKLQRQGLITCQSPPPESPARGQYEITAAGIGVLQTAIADLLSSSRDHANGFERGLANLHVLRPAQVRAALTAYRQELQSRLSQAEDRQQQMNGTHTPFHVAAMLDHHVTLIAAELDWVDRFLEEWLAQMPAGDEPAIMEAAAIPRMKQVVLPQDADSPHRAATRAADPPEPGQTLISRATRPRKRPAAPRRGVTGKSSTASGTGGDTGQDHPT